MIEQLSTVFPFLSSLFDIDKEYMSIYKLLTKNNMTCGRMCRHISAK